jgi:hypothetical protein
VKLTKPSNCASGQEWNGLGSIELRLRAQSDSERQNRGSEADSAESDGRSERSDADSDSGDEPLFGGIESSSESHSETGDSSAVQFWSRDTATPTVELSLTEETNTGRSRQGIPAACKLQNRIVESGC